MTLLKELLLYELPWRNINHRPRHPSCMPLGITHDHTSYAEPIPFARSISHPNSRLYGEQVLSPHLEDGLDSGHKKIPVSFVDQLYSTEEVGHLLPSPTKKTKNTSRIVDLI